MTKKSFDNEGLQPRHIFERLCVKRALEALVKL